MVVTTQWLESLAEPSGLLADIQKIGRIYLSESGLPQSSNEEWRFANLKKLEEFLSLKMEATNRKDKNTTFETSSIHKAKDSLRIVIDKDFTFLKTIELPQGIRLLSNEEIRGFLNHMVAEESLLEKWQLAINHASARQIIAIHITNSNKQKIELIIKTLEDSLCSNRLLIVVDQKADLELLEVVQGSNSSANSHLVEIYLREEASMNHGLIALGNGNDIYLGQTAVVQEPNSNYAFTSVVSNWKFLRFCPSINQIKGKANTKLRGLQVSQEEQQLSTHSKMIFNGPQGRFDQLQKTLAADKSHSIFNGKITVPKSAQKTDASQLSRNILLSRKARIDTKPELEIIADDVKCAHGATVSQLQEDELFYMQSRGISTHQSTQILLKGYFQEIIDCLPLNPSRWLVIDKLLESI